MNDAPLNNRQLLAMLTDLLEEQTSADEVVTTTLAGAARLHSPVVYIRDRWYETSESTFGPSYVLGLEIEDGVLTTNDPNRPRGFPAQFRVRRVRGDATNPSPSQAEHEVVGLLGTQAVESFRSLKWSVNAVALPRENEPGQMAEAKPLSSLPEPKSGLGNHTTRSNAKTSKRH